MSGWRVCACVCMGCVCVCLMPSTQILFLYGQAAAIYSRLHGPLIPSLPPSQPSLPHTVLPFSPAPRHFFPSPNKLLFSSYNTCLPTCLSCPTHCPPYPDLYLKSTVSINRYGQILRVADSSKQLQIIIAYRGNSLLSGRVWRNQ